MMSKKLDPLREILHHLSIASFQERIDRKVETTILSLGGMGDFRFGFPSIAMDIFQVVQNFPQRP